MLNTNEYRTGRPAIPRNSFATKKLTRRLALSELSGVGQRQEHLLLLLTRSESFAWGRFSIRTRGNRLLGHDVHVQIMGQSLRRKARQTSRPLHLSIKRIKEVASCFFHGHLGHEYKQSMLNKQVETRRILLCTSKVSPGMNCCPFIFFPLFIWACGY